MQQTKNSLDELIQQTQAIIESSPPADPAMVSVLQQLKALKAGTKPSELAIGRTIAYNYTPAPEPIEQWCDNVLRFWSELKKNGNG